MLRFTARRCSFQHFMRPIMAPGEGTTILQRTLRRQGAGKETWHEGWMAIAV
jgi:hypothetical protein